MSSADATGSLLTGLKTRLRLGLASTMAIPALRRLQDYLNQSSTSLPSGSPVWLLGTEYAVLADGAPSDESAGLGKTQAEALVLAFLSLPWMTYRRDFAPLPGGFTSDVGWGCTLRSGQMLLAEALIVHFFGPGWRIPDGLPAAAGPAEPAPPRPAAAAAVCEPSNSDALAEPAAAEVTPAPPAASLSASLDDAVVVAAAAAAAPHSELLRWFADAPAQPFSLHALVAAGAPHGVVAGQWLGPHALCQTLAAAVDAACGGQLRVHVATSGGGGAPTLYRELPDAPAARSSAERPAAAAAAAAAGLSAEGGAVGAEQEEGAGREAGGERCTSGEQGQQEGASSSSAAGGGGNPPGLSGAPFGLLDAALPPSQQAPDAASGWRPLLVLVPLVLGLGKQINPAYLPQLGATFRFPQSLGVVGGKPGSSLYFVGCQEESGSVVFLDPHEVQPAEDAAAPRGALPTQSFHCGQLRHTPMATMDPSLALAFYARTRADYHDLCGRLEELAKSSRLAPLLTVEQRPAPLAPHRSRKGSGGRGGRGGGEREGAGGRGGDTGETEAEQEGDGPEVLGAAGEGERPEEEEEEADWEMI